MASSTNTVGISCTGGFTLFLKNNGTVYASGYNGHGQLGFGNTTQYTTPQLIPDLEDIIQVSAGPSSNYGSGCSFFLKRDGTVYSTGYNGYGQLGIGNTTNQTKPVKVNIEDVTAIAAGGGHTLFLKRDGTVYSCGLNTYGQLGTNNTTQQTNPVKCAVTNVIGIAAGISNNGGIEGCSLFLKSNGTVWGCGYNAQYGQLGFNSTDNITSVRQLPITNVVDMCISGFSLFLKGDGTVWGCGCNNNGQLAIGNTTNTTTITKSTISDVVAISCVEEDYGSSIFLKNDGTVWVCGRNSYYQLCDGTTTTRTTPQRISTYDNVLGVHMGNYGGGGISTFFIKKNT